MNCRGCGTTVEDPSLEAVNQAVDEVLEASLEDAHAHGGVCPLCGHSKDQPFYLRDHFRTGLLLGVWVLLGLILGLTYYYHSPIRTNLAELATQRALQDDRVKSALGEPIQTGRLARGGIKRDETGWSEGKLEIPLKGPKASGTLRVAAGQGTGPWVISTLEVWVEREPKPINLLRGKVEVTSGQAYVSVHIQDAEPPELIDAVAPPASSEGSFPVVRIAANYAANGMWKVSDMRTSRMLSVASSAPDNIFEVDLRSGKFVLHRTDLFVPDTIPLALTRDYYNFGQNDGFSSGAFGAGASHNYDICPFGTRNPYTYMNVYVGDGQYLHFNRISTGTSYADAVYEHTETTEFYKSRFWWSGGGWTLRLPDGRSFLLPDSYYGTTLAQGAPYEMTDAQGRRVQLIRDGQRNLRKLISPNGRTISLETNAANRVIEAHDDNGHSVRYQYDSRERLTNVNDNQVGLIHYNYSDENLLSVSDAAGGLLLRNIYYGGRVAEQILADQRVYRYQYVMDQNEEVIQTVVTLPDGNIATLNFHNDILTSESVRPMRLAGVH